MFTEYELTVIAMVIGNRAQDVQTAVANQESRIMQGFYEDGLGLEENRRYLVDLALISKKAEYLARCPTK